jgi:hypothetical protein
MAGKCGQAPAGLIHDKKQKGVSNPMSLYNEVVAKAGDGGSPDSISQMQALCEILEKKVDDLAPDKPTPVKQFPAGSGSSKK